MATATAVQEKTLNQVLKQQKDILTILDQIRAQMKIFGSLQRFEELTKKGNAFARLKGIKPQDVLRYD